MDFMGVDGLSFFVSSGVVDQCEEGGEGRALHFGLGGELGLRLGEGVGMACGCGVEA